MFHKSLLKNELPSRRFMGYKPIHLAHDNFHGIICSNETIFGTLVYLSMANNVAFGCFQIACIKNEFSIFEVRELCFCVKKLPKIHTKNGPHQLVKVVGHIWCTFHKLAACERLVGTHIYLGQMLVKVGETWPNLNYNSLIARSWFFGKIIFRFTICCFNMDLPIG